MNESVNTDETVNDNQNVVDGWLRSVSPRPRRTNRIPLFACQECGKKFYNAESANRAVFGDNGCPKCGGSDIDVYVP